MTTAQVKTAADDLNTALVAGDATVDEINADTGAPGLAASMLALTKTIAELMAGTGRGAHWQAGLKP